jgi:hypothetical protein
MSPMSSDKVRDRSTRVAANVAKLPDLLRQAIST